MREIHRWGLATGLAAALALFGSAQAQTPGTSTANNPSSTGTSGSDTTTSRPGERSGYSGNEANKAGGSSDTSGSAATSGSTDTSRGAAPSQTGKKSQIKKSLSDSLEKFHAKNQAEIHMGQMAEQQAQSPELKEYGRKLAQDHQKVDSKLQSEAQNLGVTLEGKEFEKVQKDGKKHMDKLQGKSGADFDKEFLSMAEKDHEKDVKDVQKAAKEAQKENQEGLAKLLQQAASGMQGHLTEAKRLKETVGKQGQRQGRRGSAKMGGSTSTETTPGGATPSGSPGTGSTGTGTSDTGSSSGTSGSQQQSGDTGHSGSSTGSESGRKY